MATNLENPNKQKMIDLRGQGLSYGSIAKMVGVSRARVHQICSGYNSANFPFLKAFIFKRDNYKCQWNELCKEKKIYKKDLIIHHIDFDDKNNDTKNLITLCKFCHAGFHANNHINSKIEKNLHKSKYKNSEEKRVSINKKWRESYWNGKFKRKPKKLST